jgi:alpha-L-glutamate ligase-like protein
MNENDREPREVLGINRRNLDLVFADYRPGKFRVLDDKLAAKALLEESGISCPRTLAVIKSQDELAGLAHTLAGLKDFVIKPARGWGGRGILVLAEAEEGWVKPSGERVNVADIAAHVSDVLSGIYSLDEDQDQAIFEERIYAHPFFAGIYDRGLADLRVVLDKERPIQAMCRLPADASDGKANLHAGGVGLGIDIETGISTGAVCKDKDILVHPDTGAELIGRQLPYWDTCVELARRASGAVDLDYLGVDIVVDRERGPLILELNARPGLAIQLANKEGQPIAPRPGPSLADRVTFAVAWTLLVLMAVLPIGFEFWQSRAADVVWVETETDGRAATADPDQPAELLASDLLVTDDEELSLSESSELFGRARTAAAAGDTATARALYESALPDSTLAPFALNNLALMDHRAGRDLASIARLQSAIERFPAYGRGYYNLGLVLMDLDRNEEAVEAFETALEIQPSHSGSWANLGQLRFADKDYIGAEEALVQAIRFQPDARNARLRLGLTYRLQNDLPRAQRRFGELLALNPDSEAATYWWSRTVMEQIRADRSTVIVSPDSLLAILTPHLDETDPSSRCQSLAACIRWEQGDRPHALALFLGLIQQGYQKRSSRRSAAAVAVDLGQWRLADTLLGRARESDDPVVQRMRELTALGAGLDEWERSDRGNASFDLRLRSLKFESDDLEILRLLLIGDLAGGRGLYFSWSRATPAPVWFAWAIKDPDGADAYDAAPPTLTAETLAALECDPDHFGQRRHSLAGLPPFLAHWVLLNLAWERDDQGSAASLEESMTRFAYRGEPVFRPLLLRNMARDRTEKKWRSAGEAGNTLLRINPGDQEVRLAIAAIELENRRPAAARSHLKLLPRDLARGTEARVLMARVHIAEGRPDKGLKELDKALAGDPENQEARFARGMALFDQGKKRQASNELRAVLNQAPDRVDVRRALARQLMQRKRYADAIGQWNRIVRLGGATASDRFNLALSYQRDKQYAESLAAYDSLLNDQPENVKAWFNRSLALSRIGRDAEARAGYQHVLTLDPGHAASRAKLGLPSAEIQGDQ